MAWIKLDDHFFRNPKVVAAGRDARDLYLAGLCYCGSGLTDGLIPAGALRMLGADADIDNPKVAADALVNVGLWECGADGSFTVHDYLDYNPTKARVLATRAVRAEVGSKGGKQRASNLLEADLAFATENLQAKSNPVPSPARPTPVNDPSGANAPERAGKPRDVRAKATVIAEDWEPTPELRAYAVEWGVPEPFVDEVAAEFVKFWRQSKGRKIDWGMTFQNRVRDVAPQYARRARASPNGVRAEPLPFAGAADRLTREQAPALDRSIEVGWEER